MDWNNINEDRDTSGLGPIEYDQSKVPQLIRKHADNVRGKSYGQQVREAQARNAEYAGLIASEAVNRATNADILSKDTQNRFKDQIEGTTNSDEVIDARRPFGVEAAFQTLSDRLEHDIEESVSRTQKYGVLVTDFGAVGDGIQDDGQAFQDAIDYCLENKRELLVPAPSGSHYLINKQLIINSSVNPLSIRGVGGSDSIPTTILQFAHTDGSHCILPTKDGYSNAINISNLTLDGNPNTGDGIHSEGILVNLRKMAIRNMGGKELYMKEAYGFGLYDVFMINFSGKTIFMLEKCSLAVTSRINAYGKDDNLEPAVIFNDVDATTHIGININGQQGLQMTNCNQNFITGYHEITGNVNAVRKNYSLHLDENSSNNDIKLKTIYAPIDHGYNNKWQTDYFSNTFKPVNPKYLVDNVPNPTFENDLHGQNYGGFTRAWTPTPFSGMSVRSPLTSGPKYLLPTSHLGDYGYMAHLKAGVKYIAQFTIWSDSDLSKLTETNRTMVNFSFHTVSGNVELPYFRDIPIYDKPTIYQFEFETKVDSVAGFRFEVVNGVSGTSNYFRLGDYVIAPKDSPQMPKLLASPPSHKSRWVGPTAIPNSMGTGVIRITESGNIGKSITELEGVVNNTNVVTLSSGSTSQLEVGDYIKLVNQTYGTHARKVLALTSNTITIDYGLNSAGVYKISIKDAVITEFKY